MLTAMAFNMDLTAVRSAVAHGVRLLRSFHNGLQIVRDFIGRWIRVALLVVVHLLSSISVFSKTGFWCVGIQRFQVGHVIRDNGGQFRWLG